MEQNLVWHEDVECFLCGGTGKIVIKRHDPSHTAEEEDCPHCGGEGKLRIMKR